MITRAQGAKKNPGTNISQLTGVGSTKFIYDKINKSEWERYVSSSSCGKYNFLSVRRYILQCLAMVNMEFCSRVYFYVRVQYCLDTTVLKIFR